jgi:hypothetical protein
MANTNKNRNVNKSSTKSPPGGEEIEEFDVSMFEAAQEWVEQQTGFPPYWNPVVDEDSGKGNGFKAKVMARDERDPEFIRYVLQATMGLRCQNGPADDAEEVLVKPGEYFTCGDYAALPLSDYFGEEVVVLTIRKRKLAANEKNPQKRDLWNFKILVSPETALRLEERREAQARELAEAATG